MTILYFSWSFIQFLKTAKIISALQWNSQSSRRNNLNNINRQIANKMMLDLTLWHSNNHLWNPISLFYNLEQDQPPFFQCFLSVKIILEAHECAGSFSLGQTPVKWKTLRKSLWCHSFSLPLLIFPFFHFWPNSSFHQQVNFFVPCWPATQEREPILVIVHWTMSRVRFLFPTRQF